MRASVSVLAALLTLTNALPQDSPSTTVELTPQQTCLSTCDLADVNCLASCNGVPFPNETDANNTTQCAAQCDQGDGSPEATQQFSDCVQTCITQNFPMGSNTVNAPQPTGAPVSSGASPTGPAPTGETSGPQESGTSQPPASGSNAPEPTGAAGAVQMNAVAGFAGLFMAVFAL